MSILTVSNLSKSFDIDLLFENVTFSISEGEKFGLVGRNGSGKTTLLRMLLGQDAPDTGRVSLAAGRRFGYVRQEAPVHPQNTILEEVESIFEPLRKMEIRMAELEHEMQDLHDEAALSTAMDEYSHLRDHFEAGGGYQIKSDTEMILLRLGFSASDYSKTVGSCSGGEQTRLALAKMVLSRPDVLVLDEPTNHLDIEATEWLEAFLKNYDGAVILVSHDRYFLDAVCTSIADLDNQTLSVYKGNYSQFWTQKQEQLARQQALYEQQKDEINRLEDVIKRNMGADSTASKMRHRMQGRIERMDKVDRPTQDTSTVKAKIDSASAGRVGREVVQLDELTKSFGERTLIRDLNVLVERGQRVGVVGPNGAGKTTLIKMILGLEQPTSGLITLGHNVRVAYFSQHAADSLPMDVSVVEALLESVDMTSTEARNYLARFLFTGDDVFKIVGSLSGGEKNKLALAKMVVEPCNLLILDEPTNHLDITSCEALGEILAGYDGTLMIVSHDRYLLNATTNRTLALTREGAARIHEGNYAAFRSWVLQAQQSAMEPVKKPSANGKKAASAAPQTLTLSERLSAMNARELSKARVKAREAVIETEHNIDRIEQRIVDVEAMLASPIADVQKMVNLAAEHTKLNDDLLNALTSWEVATTELDDINNFMEKTPA